jgi:Transposase/Transposase IS116/IS110/IS902 family
VTIFVGNDWSENHHDIEIQDTDGKLLARRRFPEGIDGIRGLHELIADHAGEPGEVVVGIETDRGLWVAALVAAGYQVFAVNPKAVSRYRERHIMSGAKSDTGDAKVLADLVRTDRHNHRLIDGDSELSEAVKVLARSHQRLIWSRQRQVNVLRSMLREFYPAALEAFGTELAHHDAVAVLSRAPTPARGRRLTHAQIVAALKRGGRQRYSTHRATEIQTALRAEHLEPPAVLADAFGASVAASMAVIDEFNRQVAVLEAQLAASFNQHPDAEIICSLPGLGKVLGARVLAEFGDDPERFADARARRNYAATSPITIASGKRKVVRARFVSNHHLADACYWWAFNALTHSPGARAYYDAYRARHDHHDMALRALANRLVGILDGCLRSRTLYDETVAWAHRSTTQVA